MTSLQEQRTRIVHLNEQGYGIREISQRLKISRNTVRKWIRRHCKEGKLEDKRQYNHAVRRMTQEQIHDMQKHFIEHPLTPTRYFATRYDVCLQTIRNNLHGSILHYKQDTEKSSLTDAHKTARLNFAHEYLDFDWANVVFSDEKSFHSSQNSIALGRYNKNNDCKKSDRITAYMWGWMSAAGVGELVSIPSQTNARHYVDLLEETMLPTVRTVYPQEDIPNIFYVHDNCTVHTAKTVMNWFEEHADVNVISLPCKSVDLNPIENVWGLMVEMWDNRNERNKETLELHCKEIWELLRGTDMCSLVGSMRNRLQAVIDNNGGYT